MTVKEILEAYKGEYYEVEFYVDTFRHSAGFHTDRVEFIESCSDEAEVLEHQLMDEEEYNNTILANTGERFTDFYDSEDKILVVKIEKDIE